MSGVDLFEGVDHLLSNDKWDLEWLSRHRALAPDLIAGYVRARFEAWSSESEPTPDRLMDELLVKIPSGCEFSEAWGRYVQWAGMFRGLLLGLPRTVNRLVALAWYSGPSRHGQLVSRQAEAGKDPRLMVMHMADYGKIWRCWLRAYAMDGNCSIRGSQSNLWTLDLMSEPGYRPVVEVTARAAKANNGPFRSMGLGNFNLANGKLHQLVLDMASALWAAVMHEMISMEMVVLPSCKELEQSYGRFFRRFWMTESKCSILPTVEDRYVSWAEVFNACGQLFYRGSLIQSASVNGTVVTITYPDGGQATVPAGLYLQGSSIKLLPQIITADRRVSSHHLRLENDVQTLDVAGVRDNTPGVLRWTKVS